MSPILSHALQTLVAVKRFEIPCSNCLVLSFANDNADRKIIFSATHPFVVFRLTGTHLCQCQRVLDVLLQEYVRTMTLWPLLQLEKYSFATVVAKMKNFELFDFYFSAYGKFNVSLLFFQWFILRKIHLGFNIKWPNSFSLGLLLW